MDNLWYIHRYNNNGIRYQLSSVNELHIQKHISKYVYSVGWSTYFHQYLITERPYVSFLNIWPRKQLNQHLLHSVFRNCTANMCKLQFGPHKHIPDEELQSFTFFLLEWAIRDDFESVHGKTIHIQTNIHTYAHAQIHNHAHNHLCSLTYQKSFARQITEKCGVCRKRGRGLYMTVQSRTLL